MRGQGLCTWKEELGAGRLVSLTVSLQDEWEAAFSISLHLYSSQPHR